MLGRRSSFLKISLILYVSLASNLISSCGSPTLWGGDLEEARIRVRHSDFSFLRHIDFNRSRLEEMFRLGAGAGYYFSFIFRQLGLDETAARVLQLEWDRGRGVWREEAALLVLEDLASGGEYPELEKRAARFRSDFRDSSRLPRSNRLLLEALYWQQKDRDVLSMLERSEELGLAPDAELRLFRAASSCRLGLEGWEEQFAALFLEERASTLHSRALSFLKLEGRLARFTAEQAALFGAKALLLDGESTRAVEVLEGLLPLLSPQRLSTSTLVHELALAYFATGDLVRGARFLAGQAARLTPERRLEALELAGRLHRKGGSRGEAQRLLGEVIGETSDPAQRDRAIWYSLDISRRDGIAAALPDLGRLSGLWSDPWYFADILDAGITELVQRRNWAALEELYAGVGAAAPADSLARLCYLLGRGRLLGQKGTLPLGSEALLRRARDLQPDGYYGFMAATLLDDRRHPFASGGSAGRAPRRFPDPAAENPAEAELVRGFFAFGLPLEGYRRVQRSASELPPAEILSAARELSDRGRFLESIRVVYLLLRRGVREAQAVRPENADTGGAEVDAAQGGEEEAASGAGPTAAELLGRAELELLYPRAYLQDIELQAQKTGLEDTILYALVREESHFDPVIVSRAGAIGLTQLMPATAADVARRLRVEASDLTDPHLNLLLGSRHFEGLMDRLGDIPKSLMAYNAGLSRVRDWERRYSDLPMDLFVEAIPFTETRHYVRKILASAVYYGYLYRGRSPAETVGRFFPEL